MAEKQPTAFSTVTEISEESVRPRHIGEAGPTDVYPISGPLPPAAAAELRRPGEFAHPEERQEIALRCALGGRMVLQRSAALVSVVLGTMLVACLSGASAVEISRDRAIEIARQQVSFQPDHIEAVQAVSAGSPVWRVTLRGRLPGQPPGLFETVIVEINRRTGEIVSIART